MIELLRKHAHYLAEAWLPHGFKAKNYVGVPTKHQQLPRGDQVIVKAHKKHSKKGLTFTVDAYVRHLNGTGAVNDPVRDDSDTIGFKNKYQIKIKGIRPESKIDPNTLWVTAKDKSHANELADRFIKERG